MQISLPCKGSARIRTNLEIRSQAATTTQPSRSWQSKLDSRAPSADVGALVRRKVRGADGFALVTSRLSVEMIQKAAALGIPMLAAVSAPIALAVRSAEAAGMTPIAVARQDGFESFTHPHRIKEERALHIVAG
jgi:hypothetical protein